MNKQEQQTIIERILEWVASDVEDCIKHASDKEEEKDYEQYQQDFITIGGLLRNAPDLLDVCTALLKNAELDALNESKKDNPELHKAIKKAKKLIKSITE